MTKIVVIACYCCPPGKMFTTPAGQPLPCSWPDCLNGDRPDPSDKDRTLEVPDHPPD